MFALVQIGPVAEPALRAHPLQGPVASGLLNNNLEKKKKFLQLYNSQADTTVVNNYFQVFSRYQLTKGVLFSKAVILSFIGSTLNMLLLFCCLSQEFNIDPAATEKSACPSCSYVGLPRSLLVHLGLKHGCLYRLLPASTAAALKRRLGLERRVKRLRAYAIRNNNNSPVDAEETS